MTALRIGNAPVSWGIFENTMGVEPRYPAEVVAREIAAAGYAGTELGPYGYFPTDPARLRDLLTSNNLTLASAFVPVALTEGDESNAWMEVEPVARSLAALGAEHIILAEQGSDARRRHAGRIDATDAPTWSAQQWSTATARLSALARRVRDEFNLATVIHHHAGTYFETPDEISILLDSTRPDEVNLLLDTGHYAYGGGDLGSVWQQLGTRIHYLHWKDLDAQVLDRVRREALDFRAAVAGRVFPRLGQGSLDFERFASDLRQHAYCGWMIVEQDRIDDDATDDVPGPAEDAASSRAFLAALGW